MYTRLPMDSRERLKQILLRRCLKVGRFRLASGRRSHYYLDLKQATLKAEGAYLCALLILEELRRRQVSAAAIGGLSLGADPIVAAVAAVSFVHRSRFDPIDAFIVRKRPKSHGTRRYLEGYQGPEGSPVVVVDDVCTTGGSAKRPSSRPRPKATAWPPSSPSSTGRRAPPGIWLPTTIFRCSAPPNSWPTPVSGARIDALSNPSC